MGLGRRTGSAAAPNRHLHDRSHANCLVASHNETHKLGLMLNPEVKSGTRSKVNRSSALKCDGMARRQPATNSGSIAGIKKPPEGGLFRNHLNWRSYLKTVGVDVDVER
jgi:hypothetical protein